MSFDDSLASTDNDSMVWSENDQQMNEFEDWGNETATWSDDEDEKINYANSQNERIKIKDQLNNEKINENHSANEDFPLNSKGLKHRKSSSQMNEALKPSNLTRQNSYTILNQNDLFDQQQKLISQIAEVCFVRNSEASSLLRHYGWKSKDLQKEWFDNSDKVLKKVGLTPSDKNFREKYWIPHTDGSVTVQCQSAYCDEVTLPEATSLNCGHYFCNDCWTAFLTSQIENGQSCIFAHCMALSCQNNDKSHTHKFGCNCNEVVGEEVFEHFVSSSLMQKYRRWLLDQFVEGSRGIKWCPRPGCGNAVYYNEGGMKSINCSCGYSWCFGCSSEAHSPAPCDLVERWLSREKSEDATQIWLAAKTKECPKCSVRIEKNKACNHMTCIKCGASFCWLCKGDWSTHGANGNGYYVCQKYEKQLAQGKMSKEEQRITENTRALQKYTYYYKRFKSSQDSIEITKKLLTQVEIAFSSEDLQKYGFIIDALEKLISARRILQWTYPLSYYMKTSPTKHLFEYQQDILLNATESLQDIMDSNSSDFTFLLDMRKEIVNKTSAMDKFRAEMVGQVERGDFENELMNSADSLLEQWTCPNCKSDNKLEANECKNCQSCKLHAEPECKACKINMPPRWR